MIGLHELLGNPTTELIEPPLPIVLLEINHTRRFKTQASKHFPIQTKNASRLSFSYRSV
jgi:hypothetical protein